MRSTVGRPYVQSSSPGTISVNTIQNMLLFFGITFKSISKVSQCRHLGFSPRRVFSWLKIVYVSEIEYQTMKDGR